MGLDPDFLPCYLMLTFQVIARDEHILACNRRELDVVCDTTQVNRHVVVSG